MSPVRANGSTSTAMIRRDEMLPDGSDHASVPHGASTGTATTVIRRGYQHSRS